MSWFSKGIHFLTDPILETVGLINRNDTVPQASPDPRVPNSAPAAGQVVGTNTGPLGSAVAQVQAATKARGR